MEAVLKVWTTNRKIHLEFFKKFALEQLNKTPTGFSNNLIWNLGHIIVSQQRLIYHLSGLPMYIPDTLLDTYRSGTKPTGNTTKEEVEELKSLMHSLIDKTKNDLASDKFKSFTEMTTSTGFHLASLNDAVAFNTYHEGMHLGFMMNIRKFV